MTPEQEQLLIQAILRMEQGQEEQRRGQEELRRVVMETRADMAHFTEWVGVVTQAIEDLQASRARHEQLLARYDQVLAHHDQALSRHEQLLARHDQALVRHEQLLESLAAGQQQQQAILNELIRQRENSEE